MIRLIFFGLCLCVGAYGGVRAIGEHWVDRRTDDFIDRRNELAVQLQECLHERDAALAEEDRPCD